MWPFKKSSGATELSKGEFTAILIAVLALMFAIGTARWSWLILDEQVALRKDFMKLRNEMDQTNINVDAWLGTVEDGAADR
jgi:hypothetical protein